MNEIAFNDIEGLQAACTEEWGEWGPEYHMTQEKINTFADLTGDQQWIHVDEEKSAAGPFGGTIAHGFFTLSLVASINRNDAVKLTGYATPLTTAPTACAFWLPYRPGRYYEPVAA
jgi:Acyl dehydratase